MRVSSVVADRHSIWGETLLYQCLSGLLQTLHGYVVMANEFTQ